MNYNWSLIDCCITIRLTGFILKYLYIIYINYLTAKEEQFNWLFVHIENTMMKINLLISNRSASYIYNSSQLLRTAIFENVSWIRIHFY